jgi:hypothetical protein
MPCYILVEGVNIYDSVFDTDQLSIIRGGSFLLKDAIRCLEAGFRERMDPISTGASSGLFRLCEGLDPRPVCRDIETELSRAPWHHLVFLVEHCDKEDLLQAKEQLLAQLRFRQMGSITVAPDRFDAQHPRLDHPCQLEGRRIAAGNTRRKVRVRGEADARLLSLSAHTRLLYGRDKRQGYYLQEAAAEGAGLPEPCRADVVSPAATPPEASEPSSYEFTDDLESLSEHPAYPRLSRKIAVIYLDGNRFSSIQRGTLEAARQRGDDLDGAQRGLDRRIQDLRASFLRDLLVEMSRPDGRFPDAVTETEEGRPALRMETLLWGGDEMLFVLPAWLGVELLQYFFQYSAQWRTSDGRALTHAAGLVLCHAGSPIREIRELAQRLAEHMKDRLGEHRERNLWDYLVLESIDYPTSSDIGSFREHRYGPLAQCRRAWLAPPADWPVLRGALTRLFERGVFARRQLYRIAEVPLGRAREHPADWDQVTSAEGLPEEDAGDRERAERRMFQLLDDKLRPEVVETLRRVGEELFGLDLDDPGQRAWLWVHLIELWDYLAPQKEEATAP